MNLYLKVSFSLLFFMLSDSNCCIDFFKTFFFSSVLISRTKFSYLLKCLFFLAKWHNGAASHCMVKFGNLPSGVNCY